MSPLKRARLNDPRSPSQDDVALSVGITQSFYALIESGKRATSCDLADRLALYFGVPVSDIFTPARYASEPQPAPAEA